jgi:hypothetical protein
LCFGCRQEARAQTGSRKNCFTNFHLHDGFPICITTITLERNYYDAITGIQEFSPLNKRD